MNCLNETKELVLLILLPPILGFPLYPNVESVIRIRHIVDRGIPKYLFHLFDSSFSSLFNTIHLVGSETIMTISTHFTLNTGAKIPAVGFGTWQAKPMEVENAVEIALKQGYRHIDCAAIYRNETEVGNGIRKSGLTRSEIFVTGKLWNTKHAPGDVEAALDKSLKDLGLEYLDLYLMHWPW